MGNDHEGRSERRVQLDKKSRTHLGRLGVQVACRLIAKNKPGAANQGPGDGGPLALTPG